MKILQITSVPIDFVGGMEKVVWELSKNLSKKHRVTILQTNLYMNKKPVKEERREGIRIITCSNDSYLGGYGYSKEFTNKLKDIWKDYDVVHIHGYGRFTSDFSLKFLEKRKPTVFTAHGFFHSKKNALLKKAYSLVSKRLIQKATICTALTQLEKEEYIRLGVRENKILIIPNAIHLRKFRTSIHKDFRSNHSVNRGNKIVLYVGRIHESKGIHYVLEAMKNLDAKLLIVGRDVGFKKKLIPLINDLNLSNRVDMIEDADDRKLRKLYSLADAFVLFSEWEGFGITVIEAMASGTPVIVSDRGALPFIVEDGVQGFIARFPEVVDLRSKIRRVLLDNSLASEMGLRGSKFSKTFSWTNILSKYQDAYKKAIQKNENSSP